MLKNSARDRIDQDVALLTKCAGSDRSGCCFTHCPETGPSTLEGATSEVQTSGAVETLEADFSRGSGQFSGRHLLSSHLAVDSLPAGLLRLANEENNNNNNNNNIIVITNIIIIIIITIQAVQVS